MAKIDLGCLLKIVNDAAAADFLEHFLDEFDVHRMDLVVILGFFVIEYQVQGGLITLVHDGAMAFHHAAYVEVLHAGNGAQILLCAGNEFIGRLRIVRIGPKNDNVRKHLRENNEAGMNVKFFSSHFRAVFSEDLFNFIGAADFFG